MLLLTTNQDATLPMQQPCWVNTKRVIDCDWYQTRAAIATAIIRIRRNGCLYSGSQSPHNTFFCLNHVTDSGRCQEVPAPQSSAPLPFSCLDCCSRDTGHRAWSAVSTVHWSSPGRPCHMTSLEVETRVSQIKCIHQIPGSFSPCES